MPLENTDAHVDKLDFCHVCDDGFFGTFGNKVKTPPRPLLASAKQLGRYRKITNVLAAGYKTHQTPFVGSKIRNPLLIVELRSSGPKSNGNLIRTNFPFDPQTIPFNSIYRL